ncbi:DUF6314 family protein [Actinoplanes sp. NPDC051343]|uniref:DUF6314 family protein n=1 Tax=Actinoplanes sp. NPDC051343 TaxID=3363906 RepID=UPI0037986E46
MTAAEHYPEPRDGAVAHRTAADFLRGRWSVRRRVVDHRRGVEGVFVGWARFSDDLAYEEHGELSFGGHRGPAERFLRYVDRGDHVLDVKFADGRDFYRLDLSDGRWSAEHPCRDDAYVVAGQITGPDTFTEHWHATGPDKDYELLTTYERG